MTSDVSAKPNQIGRLDPEALSWLLDVTTDAVAVRRLDDGRLVQGNRAYAEFVGRPLEELIGTTPVEAGLTDEDGHRRWLSRFSGGRTVDLDSDIALPDGVRRIHVTARVLDVAGVPCTVALMRDLTERQHTREALERRGRILEAVTFAA